MQLRRKPILAIATLALLGLGLAACGGSSNSSNSNTAAATTGGGTDSVATKSIGGVGTVLVDSTGNALYTNNKDSGMKVACTGECAAIWLPLMAPSSGQPTSSDQAVQAKLGIVMAGKGGNQVTFDGKPLYTFAQDSAGKVTGNGVTDSFGGTSFTWTVASTGPTSTSSSAGSGSGGGGSSGGYGY